MSALAAASASTTDVSLRASATSSLTRNASTAQSFQQLRSRIGSRTSANAVDAAAVARIPTPTIPRTATRRHPAPDGGMTTATPSTNADASGATTRPRARTSSGPALHPTQRGANHAAEQPTTRIPRAAVAACASKNRPTISSPAPATTSSSANAADASPYVVSYVVPLPSPPASATDRMPRPSPAVPTIARATASAREVTEPILSPATAREIVVSTSLVCHDFRARHDDAGVTFPRSCAGREARRKR